MSSTDAALAASQAEAARLREALEMAAPVVFDNCPTGDGCKSCAELEAALATPPADAGRGAALLLAEQRAGELRRVIDRGANNIFAALTTEAVTTEAEINALVAQVAINWAEQVRAALRRLDDPAA
jgi:hypothetical protein